MRPLSESMHAGNLPRLCPTGFVSVTVLQARRRQMAHAQDRRVVSGPKVFPYPFRHYCDSCGSGSSMLWCGECLGDGIVLTEPGGAGVPFKMGRARCKTCNGLGVVPCPICGGREVTLPPPDPDRGPQVPLADDQDLDIFDWLAKFAGG